jgi:hypothetical protein
MDGRYSLRDGRRTSRGTSEPVVEVLELRCECGRHDCGESLRVSVPTLDWARSRGLTLVAHGHEVSADAVMERTTSFVLVRAHGD